MWKSKEDKKQPRYTSARLVDKGLSHSVESVRLDLETCGRLGDIDISRLPEVLTVLAIHLGPVVLNPDVVVGVIQRPDLRSDVLVGAYSHVGRHALAMGTEAGAVL